jgi:hypothetical protein
MHSLWVAFSTIASLETRMRPRYDMDALEPTSPSDERPQQALSDVAGLTGPSSTMPEIYNPNPTVFASSKAKSRDSILDGRRSLWLDDLVGDQNESDQLEPIDQAEVFGLSSRNPPPRTSPELLYPKPDLIRSINDPEYPHTLEELRVVSAPQINVTPNRVLVEFTPTTPHCGMSTTIGTSVPCFFGWPNEPPWASHNLPWDPSDGVYTYLALTTGNMVAQVSVFVFAFNEAFPSVSKLMYTSSLAHTRPSSQVCFLTGCFLPVSDPDPPFVSARPARRPVNRQLNDKERVAAALENPTLVRTLEQCLASAIRRGLPAD